MMWASLLLPLAPLAAVAAPAENYAWTAFLYTGDNVSQQPPQAAFEEHILTGLATNLNTQCGESGSLVATVPGYSNITYLVDVSLVHFASPFSRCLPQRSSPRR